jgi:hypothetical protein
MITAMDTPQAGERMAETVRLTEHPILITLRDVISGDGFLAGITLSGRALMRQEDGAWWMYGVRPAPIAESGETIDEAFSRFRNRYKEVLFDLAQESRDFDEFKASVERFFYESDEDSADERSWEEALKAIRAANCAPPEPFAKLPREAAESKPSQITVERLNRADARFRPSDNITDTYSVPMAHAA